MWDRREHNFGTIKKGTTNTTSFTYLGDKKIKEVEPLCSCVGYRFDNGVLNVHWKVKPNIKISHDSHKIIMVTYSDDTIDDLTLKAYIQV